MIRFTPVSASTVLRRAEQSHRRNGHWFSSVFLDGAKTGETSEQVVARLLVASEISGIDLARNLKYYMCSRAERILMEGFAFEKDGYEGEVLEHYSVDLAAGLPAGTSPTVEDAERLLKLFDPQRR